MGTHQKPTAASIVTLAGCARLIRAFYHYNSNSWKELLIFLYNITSLYTYKSILLKNSHTKYSRTTSSHHRLLIETHYQIVSFMSNELVESKFIKSRINLLMQNRRREAERLLLNIKHRNCFKQVHLQTWLCLNVFIIAQNKNTLWHWQNNSWRLPQIFTSSHPLTSWPNVDQDNSRQLPQTSTRSHPLMSPPTLGRDN